MIVEIALGAALSWGVVEGSPWLVEQMIKYDHQIEQEEDARTTASFELIVEDKILNSGNKQIPVVIVEPIPNRERLVITK
jgi:DNA-directed RNA polymerase specialized sigma subunit